MDDRLREGTRGSKKRPELMKKHSQERSCDVQTGCQGNDDGQGEVELTRQEGDL